MPARTSLPAVASPIGEAIVSVKLMTQGEPDADTPALPVMAGTLCFNAPRPSALHLNIAIRQDCNALHHSSTAVTLGQFANLLLRSVKRAFGLRPRSRRRLRDGGGSYIGCRRTLGR